MDNSAAFANPSLTYTSPRGPGWGPRPKTGSNGQKLLQWNGLEMLQ